MVWFSLWMPMVLQFAVPGMLFNWMMPVGSRAHRIASAGLTGLYLIAIGLGGLWLVLPWCAGHGTAGTRSHAHGRQPT